MKRLLAAAALLTFIFIAIFTGFNITNRYFDKMSEKLTLCETAYKNGNKKSAAKLAAEIEEYWHDSEKVLVIFLNRYTVDDIAETSNRMRAFAESGDDSQFFCEISVCRHQLEDLEIAEKYLIY